MIGKGIIRGKSYSVIKRHKITQCCKRRKSSSFVFLLSLVTLSCWGFYVLKVYLSVSTFACLNPIFYSGRSNHLQIQIKSVKRLLKTPQLLLIVHRIKSKHLFVAYKAVMIWLLPPSLTSSPTPFPYLLTSSHAVLLSSLWGMSFHLQKLCEPLSCMECSTSRSSHASILVLESLLPQTSPLLRVLPCPDKLDIDAHRFPHHSALSSSLQLLIFCLFPWEVA